VYKKGPIGASPWGEKKKKKKKKKKKTKKPGAEFILGWVCETVAGGDGPESRTMG